MLQPPQSLLVEVIEASKTLPVLGGDLTGLGEDPALASLFSSLTRQHASLLALDKDMKDSTSEDLGHLKEFQRARGKVLPWLEST